ncbi:hypothetical protein DM02DRAFT_618654 [Periconia macrospinosa]|uniref:Uncharacterized protein n=1 Tax=Periconia macrospinosa TaxID=97972 RepID=A0A2V1DB40_9PLEO|nr:hypothetical protein DM02DRAFT_618654 [Periconia macrospinosa]
MANHSPASENSVVRWSPTRCSSWMRCEAGCVYRYVVSSTPVSAKVEDGVAIEHAILRQIRC